MSITQRLTTSVPGQPDSRPDSLTFADSCITLPLRLSLFRNSPVYYTRGWGTGGGGGGGSPTRSLRAMTASACSQGWHRSLGNAVLTRLALFPR